jgi:hypothetical protein
MTRSFSSSAITPRLVFPIARMSSATGASSLARRSALRPDRGPERARLAGAAIGKLAARHGIPHSC